MSVYSAPATGNRNHEFLSAIQQRDRLIVNLSLEKVQMQDRLNALNRQMEQMSQKSSAEPTESDIASMKDEIAVLRIENAKLKAFMSSKIEGNPQVKVNVERNQAVSFDGVPDTSAINDELESLKEKVFMMKRERRASEKKGNVDKNDNSHDEMLTTLIERGAVLGSVQDSWDVKRTHIGVVCHDKPDAVVQFFLEESHEGTLRREIVHKYAEGDKGTIVFWQHYVKGGTKLVE
mmetsp:Transcript_6330/g.12502  ORF Transcript_6330/g.12502 Transcript_6330/m.12502 type:complete len:234 (+) Transcript_6330:333-1034(+)